MCPDETRGEDLGDDPSRLPPEESAGPPGDDDPGHGPGAGPPSEHGLDVLHPDDLDDDDDDYDDEDDLRTLLITGASGNLAQKLRAAWDDVYDLVLIDRVANHDDEVIVADLAEFDESWLTHFHGVDTVVHLAALPDVLGAWEDLERDNIDTLANVLHACALAGVERVVFASSSHVMGGYLALGDMPITADLPPKPITPYGATKLVGERLGRSLARAFDITFIALRLGWIQAGENRPDTLPDDAARDLWMSNRDLLKLMECAVETELDDNQFVVVNGMSNNRGSRWDMSAAAELLGFVPEDDAYAEEL